ncbi:MAG: GNAT family N-acetyltransferase [Janthinobacterium lividum]
MTHYGSIENFLNFASGYVPYYNGKVISEEYIMRNISNNHAEISIATKPSHQRQGAATQIASFIAEKCIELNLSPIWSCQADNKMLLKNCA